MGQIVKTARRVLLSGIREDREELRILAPSARSKEQLWSGVRATDGLRSSTCTDQG